MKTSSIFPILALLGLSLTACDRQSPETARKIAELEQQNLAAAERQRELEQQIEDQRLAVERDAIERERALIEEERAALEREAQEVAAGQEEELRRREAEIADREARLETVQDSVARQEDELAKRGEELSGRDREIAGREALPFESVEENVPVGDYGTFHDSLSSYGSWFETPDYGYVWQPAAVRESNWRPYSRGRWVCSDRGWTWVSDEPFGWATYHYGRWALLSGRGWIWVPGSEWAPSWVSWRENDSHIGWAPLPPETLAWQGHNWDSTVDVSFGIGAAWFNFVEIRNFGNPIYQHCLPVAGNRGWYGNTVNITYIHVKNRQVISGGPRYDRINRKIGRPIPFYRLDMDRQPRFDRGHLATRPEIKGGRLRVAAPNLDADWNAGLRPGKVRGKIEQVNVERGAKLDRGITDQFRRSRIDGRERADRAIAELGGKGRFEERRKEMLMTNRKELQTPRSKTVVKDKARNPIQPEGEIARISEKSKTKDAPKVASRPAVPSLPEGVTRGLASKPQPDGLRSGKEKRIEIPNKKVDAPKVSQRSKIEEARGGGSRMTIAPPPEKIEKTGKSGGDRKKAETRVEQDGRSGKRSDAVMQETQRRADEARQAQQNANKRQQEDQVRQQQQFEKQRLDKQANDARNQAMEKSRKQQAAQDEARRQEQQKAARRQQEDAQRQQEAVKQQRKQEEARQRQQEQQQQQRQMEKARQQQVEQERQRQVDRQRQQQQADQQRQQEQGRQRQQEEARQQSQRREEQGRQEQGRQQQRDNDQRKRK